MTYAILVVLEDGRQEYLMVGGAAVAKYHSKASAQSEADFLKMGIGDEVQSISVVRYPSRAPLLIQDETINGSK